MEQERDSLWERCVIMATQFSPLVKALCALTAPMKAVDSNCLRENPTKHPNKKFQEKKIPQSNRKPLTLYSKTCSCLSGTTPCPNKLPVVLSAL